MNGSGSTAPVASGPRRRCAHAFALTSALFICALLAAACSTPREYPRTEAGVQQLLQDFADDYIEDTDSVGIVVGAILPDDTELTAVSGRSDVLDPTKELTPDTIFPIGSLTKNMVFEMVTELERTGQVDLDTPLKDCPGLDLPRRSRHGRGRNRKRSSWSSSCRRGCLDSARGRSSAYTATPKRRRFLPP